MYTVFAELMEKSGLSISETARKIGISPSTITDWRAGRTTPKADKLLKIANFYGVSVEYLMTGKDTEKESYSGKKYYFSDETAEIAQAVFDDPDLRLLFQASRDCKPENIRLAAEMLRRLKETNPEG